MYMITVIIPYYQKQAGVLRRALKSIAEQRSCTLPVHVLIVNDASPAPVEPELASIESSPFTVQVINQANAGPGAARNTGLNHVRPDTRYLAFLDSDDEWMPDHLSRAVAALGAGYDFYFSDLYHIDQTVSAFTRAGRIQLNQHPELPGLQSGLHTYQGDMLDQIIRGNIIGTPTVVYNFQRFSDKRFRVEFANAGEDYLFWMELAHSGARIAFSSQSEVRCGKGVNVYSGSGWGSEQHLLRIHNEVKYRKTTALLFPLTAIQQKHLKKSIQDLRIGFARDLIHRIGHRKKIPLSLLAAQFRLDPLTYLLFPINLVKSILTRK